MFMKEPDTVQNWIFYGDDTPNNKGFVRLLSVTDLYLTVEQSKINS